MRGTSRWVAILPLPILVVAGAAWRMTTAGIAEHYSPGWYSASTENAKHRGVYVASPTVVPAVLPLSDSVALAVTDAWVEHPTRVRYRWFLFRREEVDSAHRLVVHLAQTVRGERPWTYAARHMSFGGEFLLNGQSPARSGSATVQTLYLEFSGTPPDTVRLSWQRR